MEKAEGLLRRLLNVLIGSLKIGVGPKLNNFGDLFVQKIEVDEDLVLAGIDFVDIDFPYSGSSKLQKLIGD